MNPELRRNLWIELTDRRMMVVALIVALVVGLGLVSSDLADAAALAETTFYILVLMWGTRSAADCVVEEITNRTWDAQRLSAIGPWTMVWGKLLGAASLAWFGGLLCLAVILTDATMRDGPVGAARDLAYYLAIGLFAHAVAMMASLVAIRRGLKRNRFGVFLYQSAGLMAAVIVWRVWQSVDLNSIYNRMNSGQDPLRLARIDWWGLAVEPAYFYVASLIAFAGWTLLANYRLMRAELQVQNGPFVWLAFLVFAAAYAAGFDGWKSYVPLPDAVFGMRATQAGIVLIVITYVMALLEPKDVVLYRRLGRDAARFRLARVLYHFPRWAFAYLAAVACGIVATQYLPFEPIGQLISVNALAEGGWLIIAVLGFVARDCAILLAFGLGQPGKRSDLAALAVLGLLYLLLPPLLGGVRGPAGILFYPWASDPAWLSPLIVWAEAAAAWIFTLRRPDLRLPAVPATAS